MPKVLLLDLQTSDRLHERGLKRSIDRHDFSRRLHLREEGPIAGCKLIKRPSRDLDNTVVQGRLEASLGCAGDLVFDLIECLANRYLGGDPGDGVPSCFGGK